MPHWPFTFKIKDLLSDKESPEECVRVAKAISKRLRQDATIPFRKEHLITCFNRIKKSDANPLAEVNAGLNRLYEWADKNRIWIE